MKNENQVTKGITTNELVEILKTQKIGTFAFIKIETVLKMNKTNNPYFGLITKKSEIRILLGSNYQNRVNNNLEKESKESNFIAESCKVGNHVSECVLYNENTKLFYLQYEFFKEIKPKVNYFFNENLIELEKFSEFVPEKTTAKQKGLIKKVNTISVKIENIKEISLNKIKYIVS
jgi:hypothetical protein